MAYIVSVGCGFDVRAFNPILGRYPTLGHIEGERAGRFHGPERIMSEVVVGWVEGVKGFRGRDQ